MKKTLYRALVDLYLPGLIVKTGQESADLPASSVEWLLREMLIEPVKPVKPVDAGSEV